MEPDSEAEKVNLNLRHEMMEERKGAEEWMMGYALQQVIMRLSPARKRKAELLLRLVIRFLSFKVYTSLQSEVSRSMSLANSSLICSISYSVTGAN